MLIDELEAVLDEKYHNVPLPSKNSHLARWYLFMVADDLLLNIWQERKDFRLISTIADRLKYSLKHALIRIDKELPDVLYPGLPEKVDPLTYTATVELLWEGMEYSSATKICTLLHEGISEIKDDSSRILITESYYWRNLGYSAIEVFDLNGSADQFFLLLRALDYLVKPQSKKLYVAMAKACSVDEDSVITYTFDIDLCMEFAKDVPVYKSMIPETWIFSWGNGDQVNRLLWALNVRALFHLFSVRTAAAIHNVLGGGHESLCLMELTSKLACELSDISGVDGSQAKSFIEALTIGRATKTIDPALQPFVQIENSKVAIGCLNFLTCRQDRNMLSLHARADQRSFDRQSAVFEHRMIDEVIRAALSRKLNCKPNVNVPRSKNAGDLDILFVDVKTKVLLICELRWMIQPGDPREIVNRAKACQEKVGKIKTKVDAAKEQKRELAKTVFNLNIEPEEWSVVGIIVIDGYGGIESSDPQFPIIHKKILLEGLKYFSKLDALYNWAKSLAWLPQENVHYSREVIETKGVDDRNIERSGLSVIGGTDTYIDHVKRTIKRFK